MTVEARWGDPAAESLPSRARQWRDALPGWWAWIVLALVLAGAGVVLGYETRSTLWWADEWQWILTRRGSALSTFLQPHNQHFSLVPVALYKLLFATVGLRHYWPYRAMLIVTELSLGGLVFLYTRRRVGELYALLATALILFFGPGWQDILWPFQTAWILTLVGGVGALMALDRHDRRGDVAACLLLGLALASASPGLAVAVGVSVEVLWRRPRREVWIVAIPVGMYALWWLIYQQTTFNANSLLLLPHFVFNSATGTLSSLTGLAQINPLSDSSGGDYLSWGVPLLLVALGAMIWRLRSWRRIPPRVATLSIILLAFWLLTGLGRAYVTVGAFVLNASGDESRYLYIDAVFAVLLIAELTRVRASAAPAVAALISVLTVGAILSNINIMRGGSQLLRTQAQYTAAELGTMNLDRSNVSPLFVSNGFIFESVRAGAWFTAQRDLGSPPLSPAQLEQQPEFAREAADTQLIKIRSLALKPAPNSSPTGPAPPPVDGVTQGHPTSRGGCVSFSPPVYTPSGASNQLQVTVPPPGLLVRTGAAPATVSVRRLATRFSSLGTLAPNASAVLLIGPDPAPLPWHMQIAASAPIALCSLR